MTALELMKKNLGFLSISELQELQLEIVRMYNKDNLAERAWETYQQYGGKLQTVKFVKDVTGWGLKESKDYVDHLFEMADKGVKWESVFSNLK